MAHEYTFARKYAAHTSNETPYVYIPDQVADDQRSYDGKEFPVMRQNGTTTRARLRGDMYGLGTPGTGDPVVELI